MTLHAEIEAIPEAVFPAVLPRCHEDAFSSFEMHALDEDS